MNAKQQVTKIDDVREPVATVHTSESGAILQIIERAATNPDVDIDKMERLFAMHEKMVERDARIQFDTALALVKAEAKAVSPNQYNSQTRSRYADLAAVSKAIDPILSKHGFSLSFGPAKSELENHYGIKADLSHSGGHTREYRGDIPLSITGIKGNQMMTPTHGFGSAMSYGRRYLKCMIADLAIGDDDDGNAAGTGEVITDEQLQTLRELIEATDTDTERFCRYMKVGCLPDIPAKQFDAAIAALKNKGKANA